MEHSLKNRIPTPNTQLAIFAALVLTSSMATAQSTQWVDLYNGPSMGEERIVDMQLDPSGNLVLAGFTYEDVSTSLSTPRFLARKVDAAGVVQWTRTWFDVVSGDGAGGSALAISPSGDVLVAGSEGFFDWGLVRYDANGTKLWSAIAPTGSTILPTLVDVQLDAAGNAYVMGNVKTGGVNASRIMKFNSSGGLVWSKLYSGPGSSASAQGLAVDGPDNIYWNGTAGVSGASGELVVARFNANGAFLWEHVQGTSGSDVAASISLNSAGEIISVGSLNPLLATNGEIVVTKLNSQGVQLAQAFYDGAGGGQDTARAMALGPNDEVYVVGTALNSMSQADAFILALNADLTFAWDSVETSNPMLLDSFSSVAVDGSGDIHVAGNSAISFDSRTRMRAAEFTAGGALVWSGLYGPIESNALRPGPFVGADSAMGTFVTCTSKFSDALSVRGEQRNARECNRL